MGATQNPTIMADTATFPKARWFGLDEKNEIVPLKNKKESDRWWARNERRADVRATERKGRIIWTRFNGAMLDPKTDIAPDGKPYLFDTVVLSDSDEKSKGFVEHHTTFEEALRGHKKIISEIERGIFKID